MLYKWLLPLCKLVENKPIAILRLSTTDFHHLLESKSGISKFTLARPHQLVDNISAPTVCITFGYNIIREEHQAFIGLITSRSAITTLDSRVKISFSTRIQPSTPDEMTSITKSFFQSDLNKRLSTNQEITKLSPQLSVHVIEALASIEKNIGALQRVHSLSNVPKYYRNTQALQEDALHAAIKAFGLSSDDQATRLELLRNGETALSRINVMEDTIISYDQGHFPGFNLIEDSITGRALFKRNGNELEIFTANRNDLELAFGVDLIYINISRNNAVMLQYKMLEPASGTHGAPDWVYRPDNSLDDQINRMDYFSQHTSPDANEYRLNCQPFYLKFVKRNAAIRSGGIILPIDHFKMLQSMPHHIGPRGGFRISYNSLNGTYLRETAFLDLIRSGYIGSSTIDTRHFRALINDILRGNRALVAAIQTQFPSTSSVL